jgi:exonuclease SbcC
MKLRRVIIEGFRAYRHAKDGTFDFSLNGDACANFVSIYAPNGFGKSSFYDAVEWALTNNIGRYVRDHNRIDNNAIALSLNQPNKKQYILRNRSVNDGDPSQVTVELSTCTKIKEVPRAKNGSRDYLFRRELPEPEWSHFSEIFLSQDAVDSFLREERPESRYVKFMAAFGDKDEAYRSDIVALRRENQLMLRSISDEQAEFSAVAARGDNPAIYRAVNETIQQLGSQGESISAIGEDFDSQEELILKSLIAKQRNKLSQNIANIEAQIASLHASTEQMVRYCAGNEQRSLITQKLSVLGQSKQRLEEMKELERQREAVLEKMSGLDIRERRYDLISSSHHFYEEKLRDLARNAELIEASEKRLVEAQANLHGALHRIEVSGGLIDQIDRKLDELVLLQASMPSLYAELSSSGRTLDEISAKIVAKGERRIAIQRKIQLRKAELQAITSINISNADLDFSQLEIFNREPYSIEELRLTFFERQTKAALVASAVEATSAIRGATTRFKQLAIAGRELVIEAGSSACPLCSHNHGTLDRLVSGIQSAELFSEYENQAFEREKAARFAEDEVNGRFFALLDQLKERRVEILADLHSEIQADEKSDGILATEVADLNVQISRLREKVGELNSRLDGLPIGALNERITHQINELSRERGEQAESRNKASEEKQSLILVVNVETDRIAQLGRLQELTIANSTFTLVKQFLNETSIEGQQILGAIELQKKTLSAERVGLKERELSLFVAIQKIQEQVSISEIHDLDELKYNEAVLRNEALDLDTRLIPIVAILKRLISGFSTDWTLSDLQSGFEQSMATAVAALELHRGILNNYAVLGDQIEQVIPYIQSRRAAVKLSELEKVRAQHEMLEAEFKAEYDRIVSRLENRTNEFFYVELINSIYRKIDPHPDFKNVKFTCVFPDNEKPRLEILLSDDKGEVISPNLYFSAAQMNILSLSIFLARALRAKAGENEARFILIDDPIQSMDSINVLSMIDVLRGISLSLDKQIIISTHDRNFHELLKKKVPSTLYRSKFIELESFGKVGAH